MRAYTRVAAVCATLCSMPCTCVRVDFFSCLFYAWINFQKKYDDALVDAFTTAVNEPKIRPFVPILCLLLFQWLVSGELLKCWQSRCEERTYVYGRGFGKTEKIYAHTLTECE